MKKKKIKDLTLQNLSSTVPNKIHFEIQLRTRMHIQKPKKGKGSYNRHKRDEDDNSSSFFAFDKIVKFLYSLIYARRSLYDS